MYRPYLKKLYHKKQKLWGNKYFFIFSFINILLYLRIMFYICSDNSLTLIQMES